MSTGPGTMGLGLWGFLGVCALMMAAMMLPALAPLTSTYLRSIRAVRSRRVRTIRTTGLVGGYLLTWIGFGVVAYAAAALSALLAEDKADIAPWVGAGVLIAAGAYQLTPLKDFCLRHCRSPVAFLLHVSGYKGRLRDVRVGMYHGVYCVGCWWGLMVVVSVVGVTNLAYGGAHGREDVEIRARPQPDHWHLTDRFRALRPGSPGASLPGLHMTAPM
jgi:predicted metal-binding membrane protein